eukprot:SAG11_NODE_51808_length_108_cov_563.777778_1_plen_26_part_01
MSIGIRAKIFENVPVSELSVPSVVSD